MASHEFRTPLSTVLSSASLLTKYTQTDEQDKRDRHIGKIKGSVKHLNDILEDFLSMGKLDEGKVQKQIGEFNLHDCILDIAEEMDVMLKPGQILEHTYEGQEVVWSDKKLLRNIILNLVSNAIKFSKEGEKIFLKACISKEKILITVQDNGIGISENDQQHLFSSFFRAGNAINIQGTGLGLHIVKRYTDLLEGTAELKSQLNEGTTVYVSLPLNQG
jgi:signal transduction histidine kinase